MAEDEIPEYVKEMTQSGRAAELNDNFDSSDVVWTGFDGELDPYEIMDEYGFEPETNLENLLAALIKGHAPEISDEELINSTTNAMAEIARSRKATGRPEVNDNEIIKEVAWAYHDAFYELGISGGSNAKPKLRYIVRKVIEEYFPDTAKERSVELDSLCRLIERKFKKDLDIHLARATCDDDYDRFREHAKLPSMSFGIAAR